MATVVLLRVVDLMELEVDLVVFLVDLAQDLDRSRRTSYPRPTEWGLSTCRGGKIRTMAHSVSPVSLQHSGKIAKLQQKVCRPDTVGSQAISRRDPQSSLCSDKRNTCTTASREARRRFVVSLRASVRAWIGI